MSYNLKKVMFMIANKRCTGHGSNRTKNLLTNIHKFRCWDEDLPLSAVIGTVGASALRVFISTTVICSDP